VAVAARMGVSMSPGMAPRQDRRRAQPDRERHCHPWPHGEPPRDEGLECAPGSVTRSSNHHAGCALAQCAGNHGVALGAAAGAAAVAGAAGTAAGGLSGAAIAGIAVGGAAAVAAGVAVATHKSSNAPPRGQASKGVLRFCVSDTGVGVPASALEAIFERFWQVGKNDQRGQGLGLYISGSAVSKRWTGRRSSASRRS
jgi:hypothetical protein